MTDYPSFVAGLKYEGRDHFNRGHYCATHLKLGDKLICKLEPDNLVDPDAVNVRTDFQARSCHWLRAAQASLDCRSP